MSFFRNSFTTCTTCSQLCLSCLPGLGQKFCGLAGRNRIYMMPFLIWKQGQLGHRLQSGYACELLQILLFPQKATFLTYRYNTVPSKFVHSQNRGFVLTPG
ncbi:hypothetical protein KC19_12G038000 [Ceratodon purpureus]|uniref:Uncharacterized protein n=1 Tax=Ceratodon purpureus TaxID=3225 RepID=A0A8T0G396_CERPU|nr:hypothetical protein KC19_12G038000 [Ceratodon purpureus]